MRDKSHAFIAFCLALLCLRATEGPACADVLPALPLNQDAGHGNLAFMTVRLADGEELPCVIDTGAPVTCLDQSLEPKLGQRVRSDALWIFGAKSSVNVYAAPALYLGKNRLIKTGPYVMTHDWQPLARHVGCPIKGVIGMDILENYCVQLDFGAHQIRFLDDNTASRQNWGRAFALFDAGDGCQLIGENLVGRPGPGSLVDTGFDSGGWLISGLFQQWTNQTAPLPPGAARFPDVTLGGEIYPNVPLTRLDANSQKSGDAHIHFNGIGLEFLARNRVTLDFPEQALFLKPLPASLAPGDTLKAAEAAEGREALVYLKTLEQNGLLPGWSKNDEIAHSKVTFHFDYPDSATFDIPKLGVPFIYHYELSRDSRESPWKLIKAWCTDQNGTTIANYPVP